MVGVTKAGAVSKNAFAKLELVVGMVAKVALFKAVEAYWREEEGKRSNCASLSLSNPASPQCLFLVRFAGRVHRGWRGCWW
jgi:hypothetical protein